MHDHSLSLMKTNHHNKKTNAKQTQNYLLEGFRLLLLLLFLLLLLLLLLLIYFMLTRRKNFTIKIFI